MAKAFSASGRTLDSFSLLASLAVHLALAALVLLAGGGKARTIPRVLEVSLVDLAAGQNVGPPGPAALPAPAPGSKLALAPEKKAPKPANPPKKRPEQPAPPPISLAQESLPTPPMPRPHPPATDPGISPGAVTNVVNAGNSPASSGAQNGGGSTGMGAGWSHRVPGGGGASAQAQYLKLIRDRIQSRRQYPALARERQQEGVVRLRFTLTASGALSQTVAVVKPSGFSLLDEQASHCVTAAAPFPPFPAELQKDRLTIEVPIVYKLTDGGR